MSEKVDEETQKRIRMQKIAAASRKKIVDPHNDSLSEMIRERKLPSDHYNASWYWDQCVNQK